MTNQPSYPPDFVMPPDLEPAYTNLARIMHTPAELIFDFAAMLPGEPGPKVVARLVMSPVAAKLFLRALTENLSRFESTFGEIRLPGDPNLANDLFRTIQPPPGPPKV
jgi:hypothetical protein